MAGDDTAAFRGAKLILTCGDSLLALRRDDIPTIPWPGLWDLPGGGREGRETPIACALRELREETGLTLDPARLTGEPRPSILRVGGIAWFFRAEITAEEAASVRLGDEGSALVMMPVRAFATGAMTVPAYRTIVSELLGMCETGDCG